MLNEKLLTTFTTNLNNYFNSLKIKTLTNLEELIMRFDIPLITFQENKIHTLRILSPYLELNCILMPYIRQLFREISLKDEIKEKMSDINEIKERKKIKQRVLFELREKEN